MKSYNNLFDQIASVDNIERAIDKAAKGKRYKRSVRYALSRCHEVAERLHSQLVNGTWRPPDIHIGRPINDGIRMKKRVIVCPEFIREQVVHHALLQVIAPLFMKGFYHWSCGSVPGRGQEMMAEYISGKVRSCKRPLYYAVLDVGKCFDTLDADAIYRKVERKIRCKRTLWLIRSILNSNKVRMPDGSIRKGGLPIGLFTSPWFANFALDGVDHCFKDKNAVYVELRFMDDTPVFHTNKRKLKRAIEEATAILAEFGVNWKRHPEIHKFDHKVRICGFYVYPDGRIELHDKVYIRGRRSGRRLLKKAKSGRRITSYDAERINSYSSRFKSFGCYKAFVRDVLVGGKINMTRLREKISKAAKLKAKAQAEKGESDGRVHQDAMEQPSASGGAAEGR